MIGRVRRSVGAFGEILGCRLRFSPQSDFKRLTNAFRDSGGGGGGGTVIQITNNTPPLTFYPTPEDKLQPTWDGRARDYPPPFPFVAAAHLLPLALYPARLPTPRGVTACRGLG